MSTARRVSLPRSGKGESSTVLSYHSEWKANVCRHRWDREIKEWVKMSDDEEKQAKEEAKERKKEDLEAHNKPSP